MSKKLFLIISGAALIISVLTVLFAIKAEIFTFKPNGDDLSVMNPTRRN